jgi:cell filamentation protein
VSRPSRHTHYTSSLTDPYVDPGSQVLRNIPGLVDQRDLDEYEAFTTTIRIHQLNDREVTIAGNYDLAHLCALHRHIFQDVYQWAGKLRTVNISMDGSNFALAQFIESAADGIFSALQGDNLLRGLDRGDFLAEAAHFLVELNALHPFREGNGRTQRVLLSQLAVDAGWPIDWSGLDRDTNIEASRRGHSGDELPMLQLLDALIVPVVTPMAIDALFRSAIEWHDIVRDLPEPDVDL